MDADAVWPVVAQERSALGRLLAALTTEQWDHPSLCAGWAVRDVAAHAVAWSDTTLRQAAAATWRGRGRYNRVIFEEGRRLGARPTSDILADCERLATSRHRPPFLTRHEALLDVMVHAQDIAIPLGLHHEMPAEAAAHCAARAWRISFPFGVRRRLSGLRLEATDVDFAIGDGAPVRGPASALLLLVTGRRVALQQLSGEGADRILSGSV
jgi:uncharacterized protein (TIGR03083 family)